MMQQLSLFSGIGGIDIAAEWAGFETICFVENDKYCQNVLKKQWPNVPIIEDVKDVTKERIMAYAEQQRPGIFSSGASGEQPRCWERLSESRSATEGIALISGGFPCQPHSVAGKREGSTDERNLWPEFRRVIGEIKPRWVLAENVPGIFSSDAGRFFGAILSDLAEMGYSAGWATYGAVDVGALHRRNRVFIVGYSSEQGLQDRRGASLGESSRKKEESQRPDSQQRGLQVVADTISIRWQQNSKSTKLRSDMSKQSSGNSGLSNQRKGKQVTERRKGDSNPGYKGAVKGRHPGSKTYHANLDEYVNTPEQRNSGQLNADWVSLLMGFPADWTVIGETDGKTEPHE
jgi:DNA-cytosine methyltransferase